MFSRCDLYAFNLITEVEFYVGTYVVFQGACTVHQAWLDSWREVRLEGWAERAHKLRVRSHYNSWKGKQKETFTSTTNEREVFISAFNSLSCFRWCIIYEWTRKDRNYSDSYFAEWKQTEISIHTAKVKVNLRDSFYFQFYTVASIVNKVDLQKSTLIFYFHIMIFWEGLQNNKTAITSA